MADTIQSTPRNRLLGLLADAFGGAYDYAQRPDPTMPMGKANAVLGLLSDALPLKSAATVLDDLSYGQAPTRGTGMTTRLTPEATELALNALPFPRTAGKAALMGAGVVDMGMPGLDRAAIVYHGSPHRFNAFDSSKIGTGEGAQAYGHGLYLAEAPEVGGQYARMNLTGPANVAHVAGRDGGDALSALKRVYPGMPTQWYESAIRKGADAGNLYKVDLPDNAIARMLDWDKPLSQQAPEVQKAAALRLDELRSLGASLPADPSGQWLHKAFHPQAGEAGFGQSIAADRIRAAGIPGIRYLDGGSRGAGQGSSNFVVFPGEENMLKILERNGRSLLD